MVRIAGRLVLLVVLVAMVLAGCGGSGQASSLGAVAGNVVGVKLSSFHVSPSVATMPAGRTTFVVSNSTNLTHEMLVVRTDAPPNGLPTSPADWRIPEDQIESLGEVADLEPGHTNSVTLDLEPGSYLLLCNFSIHYKLGMATPFTVTP